MRRTLSSISNAVLGLVAVLAFSASAAATGLFVTPATYPAGTGPDFVTLADLNRDGVLDAVVANTNSNGISVLIGRGDGSFAPPVGYSADLGPFSIAVGDFNGDGNPDLAVSNSQSNDVSILLGNGGGTFSRAVNYKAGTFPTSVLVGDLNGDGKLDLVVVNNGSRTTGVLIGRGDGTFQTAGTYPGAETAGLLADFNGDGKLDLVAISGCGSVSVFLGVGNGTFQPRRSFPTGKCAQAIAAWDFNGDGKLDVAIATSDNIHSSISILLGNGDGTLGPAISYAGAGQNPDSIAVVDVNQDGKVDLVVPNVNSSDLGVYLGNGDGTFQFAPGYVSGLFPESIAVGDVNGDHIPDLVVANFGENDVAVLLGIHSGGLQAAASYLVGFSPSATAIGDFNRDGHMDMAVLTNSKHTVTIFLGTGNGSPSMGAAYVVAAGVDHLTMADFNADGFLDLAVSGSNGPVSTLLGNGDGTFQTPLNSSTIAGPVAVGDFNGDGKLDLASILGNLILLLGNGDGTFQAPIYSSVGLDPVAIVTEDLNHDGKLDLVASVPGSCDCPGTVSVLLGNGDGTFQNPSSFPVGVNPYSFAAGDLNGDGNIDLAVSNFGDLNVGGGVSVLLGVGDGSFMPQVTYSTLTQPGPIAIGDFDGNGIPDLAVNDFSTLYTVSVLPGIGDGTFGSSLSSIIGSNTGPLTVADFNEDGLPDLVALGGDNVAVLLNAGPVPVVSLSPTNLIFPSQLVGTTSAFQNVTLTNTGKATLSISSIIADGEFVQQNTCGSSVAPGTGCNIAVAFQPLSKGIMEGLVTITDNAIGSPQSITLTGSATVVSLSPTSLDFGSIPVGTTSSPQTITMTNDGTSALSIQGVSLRGMDAGDYAQTNNCGTSLPRHASCTITVTFTPFAIGPRPAMIDVSDRGGGSPQIVSLSGTGT